MDLERHVESLSSWRWWVRDAAAQSLAELGAGAAEAVPALVRALSDRQECVRLDAAEALESIFAELGPDAGRFVPDLIAVMGKKNPKARAKAARLLGFLGPFARDAVPVLIKALTDPDQWVRRDAKGALDRVRPDEPIRIGMGMMQANSVPAPAPAPKNESYVRKVLPWTY